MDDATFENSVWNSSQLVDTITLKNNLSMFTNSGQNLIENELNLFTDSGLTRSERKYLVNYQFVNLWKLMNRILWVLLKIQ